MQVKEKFASFEWTERSFGHGRLREKLHRYIPSRSSFGVRCC